MSDTVTVNSLSEYDIVADVAALIGGADNVDGIEIESVEYDDYGLDIVLSDNDGNTRTAHFHFQSAD